LLILFEEQVLPKPEATPTSTAPGPVRVGTARSISVADTSASKPVCADAAVNEAPATAMAGRHGRIRIALRMPGSAAPHSTSAIGFLVQRELGAFLGLSRTETPGDAMGPDSHGGEPARLPSVREALAVRAIAQARHQLALLAASRTAIETPRPVV